MLTTQRTYLIALVFAALVVSLVTPRALAQGTFGALPDPISSRDLNNYADRLGLSDQQMLAINEPHARYLEQFRILREREIQEFMDGFRGMRMGFDPAQISRLVTVARDFNRLIGRIRVLDEQFFGEMQALLTEEQATTMPRIRQQRERVRYTSEATRFVDFLNPAVRVDLSEIIMQLDLPPDQLEAIDPLLAHYEMRLTANAKRIFDAALKMISDGIKRFEELGFTEEAMREPAQAMRFFGAVQEIWTDTSADLLKEAGELTNLNRNTFRQLAMLLPEDSARLLRERYLGRAYPQAASIGRSASAHFNAALEMEAVPDDLHASITGMARAHMASQDRLADQIMELLDQRRRNMTLMQLANMGEDETQQRIDDLAARAETADETAIETLKAMLGPELAAALRPTQMTTVRPDRMTRMRGVGPGGRGGAQRGRAGGAGGPGAMTFQFQANSAQSFVTDTRPPDRITTTDLRDFAARLNLNPSQQTLLESMHEDYLDQFETIRRELAVPHARIVDQLRSSDSDLSREERNALIAEGLDVLEALLEAVQEADERFFADVRLAVIDSDNEDQVGTLDRMQLARERSRYQTPVIGSGPAPMGFGMAVGEARVDLSTLIASFEIDGETMRDITPALTEYETSATGMFRDRFHAELTVHRHSLQVNFPRGGADREAAQRARESMRQVMEVRGVANEISDALRSLNRDTLGHLAGALPETAAAQLRDQYHRQSYPHVFDDPDSAEVKIQAALALADLTETQRSRLFEIAADYRPKYGDLTHRILEQHIALAELPTPGVRMRGDGGGAGGWERRGELMNALGLLNFDRTELNERTTRQLRTVLSPDQIERLTAAPAGERDRAMR